MKTKPKPNRCGRRYPWAKWLANLPVTLVKGRDFAGRPTSFAIYARSVAGRGGVSIRVEGNRVILLPFVDLRKHAQASTG